MRKKFSSRGKGGNHYLENMGRVTKKYTLKRWIGKFTKNFQVFPTSKIIVIVIITEEKIF